MTTNFRAGARRLAQATLLTGAMALAGCGLAGAADKTYVLPFMTVFERPHGEVTSVKIVGDMSPLKHGWPC
jgi:ABC-type uncharacterized transport system auxiliary subunit